MILQVNHIRSKKTIQADALSRLHSYLQVDSEILEELTQNYIWDQVPHLDFNL